MSFSQFISPREADSSQALSASVVLRVMLARTSWIGAAVSWSFGQSKQRIGGGKTTREDRSRTSIRSIESASRQIIACRRINVFDLQRCSSLSRCAMVELGRVALGCAGIVAPAKSDRLWGAGGGPGNRSGIFNVYLGASANERADSWPACVGQLSAAGLGGRQKCTPRHSACTGHQKLWLSIQSEARDLSSNLDTTTTSGAF